MPVERKDPASIFGFGTRVDAEKYCDQDVLIRSGMCPNGHGLMTADADGQECPTCHFWTNCQPELASQ